MQVVAFTEFMIKTTTNVAPMSDYMKVAIVDQTILNVTELLILFRVAFE